MTILIRDIKRIGTGDATRTSIRERKVEAETISIGRRKGSDIQIDALSIQLDHAEISVPSEGDALLRLHGNATALADGRVVTNGKSVIKPGTILRLGPVQITVENNTVDETITLAVESVETRTEAISRDDEDAVFATRSVLPSKRIISWMSALIVLGFFLALPILADRSPAHPIVKASPVQADVSWNSGELSLLHSNLKNDCASCHVNAFEAVTDDTCLSCHTDLERHAEPLDLKKAERPVEGFNAFLTKTSEAFGRPADRCSSCHIEHNASSHIIKSSDAICSDCHAELDKRLPNTDIMNVSDFGTDHPEFRPYVIVAPALAQPLTQRISLDLIPKGNSGLKFPHDLHMADNNAVAKMANTLPGRYGFDDGVTCDDCHSEEAGGALFEPVRMEQDCAMCHSLTFEIEADGYKRTLRHGEPDEVIASMRDFYDAKALANIRDTATDSRTRRRPGAAAEIRNSNRRELAFKRSEEVTIGKVDAIFSEGGACYDCHEIERPVDIRTMDFKVLPISVADSFYRRSPFNHEVHEIEGVECSSCHAAETSASSSDILLPKIAVCRDCHIGQASWKAGGDIAAGKYPTNCLTCHGFHDGPHYKPQDGNP